MNINLLTTDTPHHRLFINRLLKNFKSLSLTVIFEKKIFKCKYQYKFKSLEKRSIIFENKNIINNNDTYFCHYFINDINSSKVINYLKNKKNDLTIVYGTSKIINYNLLNFKYIFNLHGSDPQKYRGLDSNFWAIYHNDFNSFKVCLHKLDYNLDTGDIYKIMFIPVKRLKIQLYQYRYYSSFISNKLVNKLINDFSIRKIKLRKQSLTGRYYGPMPTDLKKICLHKYNKFLSNV